MESLLPYCELFKEKIMSIYHSKMWNQYTEKKFKFMLNYIYIFLLSPKLLIFFIYQK